MKAQVYKDPRPKEYFDRFHERSRTREPDWVYEVVRVLTSLYAWTFFRARGIAAENVPTGPVIIAPNHFSFMDHFFVGAFIRRRVRFMAKSQLFARPMQFVYTHGGVFPVRRGYRDEEAFITANSILERGGLIVMYCEGGRSRTGKLSEQPKRGIGRLALESGATDRARPRSTAPRRCATGSGCSSPRSPCSTASRCAGRRSTSRRPTSSSRSRTRSSPRSAASTRSWTRSAARASCAQPARGAPRRAPAARYRLTSSQLAATWSSASANTTSVPGPQSTRSTAPSTSEMRSSPSPPWIVSPSWVPEMTSSPGPPST